MEYLIVAGILLMVVAPIIAVLPSPNQKRKMVLRRAAMNLGITVEITNIDDPHPFQEKYLTNLGKRLPPVLEVVAYRVHRPRRMEWNGDRRRNWLIERRADNEKGELPGTWCWGSEDTPELSSKLLTFIISNLESLPEDVVRVEECSRFISVYWHECGDKKALQTIHYFLESCGKL